MNDTRVARVWTCAALALVLGLSGCTRRPSGPPQPGSGTAVDSQWRKDRFAAVMDNLARLDEFESPETRQKLQSLIFAPPGAFKPVPDPLLATLPELEILRQAVDGLNQWVRDEKLPDDWRLDPLVAKLDERFQKLPPMQNLAALEFTCYDGIALAESMWLRDLAKWVGGEDPDPLVRTQRLFAWCVRNVQLPFVEARASGGPAMLPQIPWEVMLLGRGSAVERAELFLMLARRQGIDAQILGVREEQVDQGTPLLGVHIDGEIYLFDVQLGLPLPAENGIVCGADGRLTIRPATLNQVRAKPELLRQFEVDASRPYRPTAAQLKKLVAMIYLRPSELSARMRLIESKLAGDRRVMLTSKPSEEAERWSQLEGITGTGIWLSPLRTIDERLHVPPALAFGRLQYLATFYLAETSNLLWRGRVLYLRGKLVGEPGAADALRRRGDDAEKQSKADKSRGNLPQAPKAKSRFVAGLGAIDCLQLARPSKSELEEWRKTRRQELRAEIKAELEARPDPRMADPRQFDQFLDAMAALDLGFALSVKQDATYWLGLASVEQGNYAATVDYFQTLLSNSPDTMWRYAAKYNAGQAYESLGKTADAVEAYSSYSSFAGNLLRARWLYKFGAEKPKDTGDGTDSSVAPGGKEADEPKPQEPGVKPAVPGEAPKHDKDAREDKPEARSADTESDHPNE